MITAMLIAIEYKNPHIPLINKLKDQIKDDRFSYVSTPQIWWTVLQKKVWNEQEQLHIHWKRIEYKVENTSLDKVDFEKLKSKIEILQSVHHDFYQDDSQQQVEFHWCIIGIKYSIDNLWSRSEKFSKKFLSEWRIRTEFVTNFQQNDHNYNIQISIDNKQHIQVRFDVNNRYWQKKDLESIFNAIENNLNIDFIFQQFLDE